MNEQIFFVHFLHYRMLFVCNSPTEVRKTIKKICNNCINKKTSSPALLRLQQQMSEIVYC